MSLAAFDLTLEGALHQGTTSEDSAVSRTIIGMDRLLTNATRALYGYLVDPEVDVRRKDKAGAYEIDLGFRSNFGMARRAWLSGQSRYENPQPAAVMRALGWYQKDLAEPGEAEVEEGTQTGLVPLLLAMDGREPDRIDLVGDKVDIEAGDQLWHITNDAYRLWRHIEVRRGLAEIAKALASAEVSRMIITDRNESAELCRLDARAVSALAMPEPRDVLLVDETRTMALALAAPVFCNDRFWTFVDGAQTIRARMCDKAFLNIIDNGVFALKPGEILVVNMHVTTVQTPEGLKSTYDIVRVVDHRKPGRHLPMPGI